jgi:type VI secretion system secreted protein Hcp
MFRNPVYLILLAASMLLSANAFGQGSALYLKVKGSKQGDIKGDVTEKGKEGLIKTISFSHEVTTPRDAATGQASGKRQHKPVTILKEIDKSTPLLMAALTKNENLSEVTLSIYRPSTKTAGTNELWYTIELKDVVISGISTSWDNDKKQSREEVSFTYQKIKWTFAEGNVTFEDDLKSNRN